MSRLLILGGSPFQVPAIVHAVRVGHYVITCDYLPENPGHQFAHEYINVSTTDCEGVLTVARDREVDGVLSFASDPAATTAAHVASELNLPGLAVDAARCLSNKVLFREFLEAQGFRAPKFAAVTTLAEAQRAAEEIGFPLMVKPTDSSGSKGVSQVTDAEALAPAFTYAREFARDPRAIMEQYVERKGVQIAGDGLVVGGRLVFGCFGDEHFDLQCCAYAPVGESFPGRLTQNTRDEIFRQLQRIFSLLGVRELVFNLDAVVDARGHLMIIEIGPRSGGNCLPTAIRVHTGVDLVDIAIRQALGQDVPSSLYDGSPSGWHATWMIHSRRDGILQDLHVASEVSRCILEIQLTAALRSEVRRFTSSRDILGHAVLSFPDSDAMSDLLERMPDLISPVVL